LRRLGVPLRTVALDAFETEWGYTIDRREYALGSVALTAAEITALAIALEVTREQDARLGLAKVSALAPDPQPVATPPTRVEVGVGPLEGVADALVERRALRFTYRSSIGAASTRTVDPYGLVQRRGAWYLVGRDHDRDALRAFRLDRFTAPPVAVGEAGAYTVPEHLDLVQFTLGPSREGVEIAVAVAPSVMWELQCRGGSAAGERSDGWVEVVFPDADPDRLTPWLLAFGADVEILGPPDLRSQAVRRLQELASDHAAGTSPGIGKEGARGRS
ncbi:MAG: WYL domain-containing protein, partial [Actinomycetota bacterium]|nr:WYL domain-containing protein [Actinomycetota bacterium]